jgi:hypothetical protein
MQKTTKSKVASRPAKTTVATETVKGKKVPTAKSTPTEEQIREKAKEIYHERILRGEKGTAIDDWNNAEKILKGS